MWLVSLVSFAAASGAVAPRLLDIQEAFGSLLGDSGELTQVSLVRPCTVARVES